jgi:hypothetical protein
MKIFISSLHDLFVCTYHPLWLCATQLPSPRWQGKQLAGYVRVRVDARVRTSQLSAERSERWVLSAECWALSAECWVLSAPARMQAASGSTRGSVVAPSPLPRAARSWKASPASGIFTLLSPSWLALIRWITAPQQQACHLLIREQMLRLYPFIEYLSVQWAELFTDFLRR